MRFARLLRAATLTLLLAANPLLPAPSPPAAAAVICWEAAAHHKCY